MRFDERKSQSGFGVVEARQQAVTRICRQKTTSRPTLRIRSPVGCVVHSGYVESVKKLEEAHEERLGQIWVDCYLLGVDDKPLTCFLIISEKV